MSDAKPETRPQAVSISETDLCLRTASLDTFNEETKHRPRIVFMRFRIFDMKEIDAVAGTAQIDFAVYLRWFDPSLIMASKERFGRTVREYESLWSPKVEINNGVELKEMWDGDTSWNLKSYETGEMKYSQRYSGTIANPMDLHLFPFDADVIEIKLGPRIYRAGKVVFEHDPEWNVDTMEIKSPSLIDWDLSPQAYFNLAKGAAGHANAILSLHVQRRYMYYIKKVIVVNYFAATFSWVCFLMPAGIIEERLNLVVTLFLAEVAFCFILAAELPKVPYLTLIDCIILGSYVMLFLIGMQSAIAYILTQQGDRSRWFSVAGSDNGAMAQTAEAFDMWSFILVSTTFTAWNVFQVVRGLWHQRRMKLFAESHRKSARAPGVVQFTAAPCAASATTETKAALSMSGRI